MDLAESGCEGVKPKSGQNQGRTSLYVVELPSSIKDGNFLTNSTIISNTVFQRHILCELFIIRHMFRRHNLV